MAMPGLLEEADLWENLFPCLTRGGNNMSETSQGLGVCSGFPEEDGIEQSWSAFFTVDTFDALDCAVWVVGASGWDFSSAPI